MNSITLSPLLLSRKTYNLVSIDAPGYLPNSYKNSSRMIKIKHFLVFAFWWQYDEKILKADGF